MQPPKPVCSVTPKDSERIKTVNDEILALETSIIACDSDSSKCKEMNDRLKSLEKGYGLTLNLSPRLNNSPQDETAKIRLCESLFNLVVPSKDEMLKNPKVRKNALLTSSFNYYFALRRAGITAELVQVTKDVYGKTTLHLGVLITISEGKTILVNPAYRIFDGRGNALRILEQDFAGALAVYTVLSALAYFSNEGQIKKGLDKALSLEPCNPSILAYQALAKSGSYFAIDQLLLGFLQILPEEVQVRVIGQWWK